MSDDLVRWLSGCLDAIEQTALGVVDDAADPHGAWTFNERLGGAEIRDDDGELVDDGESQSTAVPYLRLQALHDPRGVLARVEAEREIVCGYTQLREVIQRLGGPDDQPVIAVVGESVKYLAHGHRYDHPGYDPAWMPGV